MLDENKVKGPVVSVKNALVLKATVIDKKSPKSRKCVFIAKKRHQDREK